jgi:hypothetical protein
MPSIECQLRRLGTQRRIRTARTAPLAAPRHPLPFLSLGNTKALLLAAVVRTVTDAVPLVVPVLSVTVWLLVQVGRSLAPAGCDVTAHVKLTVPV